MGLEAPASTEHEARGFFFASDRFTIGPILSIPPFHRMAEPQPRLLQERLTDPCCKFRPSEGHDTSRYFRRPAAECLIQPLIAPSMTAVPNG